MKQQEWQKGNETKVSAIEVSILHSEWLKQMHEDVRKDIELKNKSTSTETESVGFVELD